MEKPYYLAGDAVFYFMRINIYLPGRILSLGLGILEACSYKFIKKIGWQMSY